MVRRLLTAVALALLGASTAVAAGPAEQDAPYTDLTQAFVEFYDRTQGLDDDARVAAFKAEVASRFPGFYAPRDGKTEERWERQLKSQLADFPAIRERYAVAQRDFGQAYADARRHFALTFPESRVRIETWFLHSLGEMDGGTREIGGRTMLIFGADGIARYHSPEDIGPFFDHELFHVEHGQYFPECEQVWCALWIEGLATAAAEQMNPGIGEKALMLETPRPIAPTVDPNWRLALCTIGRLADATGREDYRLLFFGDGGDATFAPRWGYYVGWKLAKRVLADHALVDLAHMPPAAAEPLVKSTLTAMTAEAGGCPPA